MSFPANFAFSGPKEQRYTKCGLVKAHNLIWLSCSLISVVLAKVGAWVQVIARPTFQVLFPLPPS